MKIKNSKEKTVNIRLPRISGKEESVYISVGDRSFRIMRGVDVTIPECAYDVLRNSEIAGDSAIAYSNSKN